MIGLDSPPGRPPRRASRSLRRLAPARTAAHRGRRPLGARTAASSHTPPPICIRRAKHRTAPGPGLFTAHSACICTEGGLVACTEMACICDPASETRQREYAGLSPLECSLINFACPDNTTYFRNDCGCGCERTRAARSASTAWRDRARLPATWTTSTRAVRTRASPTDLPAVRAG